MYVTMGGNVMNIAVISSSNKVGEKRVPLHPEFLEMIDNDLIRHFVFETGYGKHYGVEDCVIESITGNMCKDKNTLLATCDKVIITKPTHEDVELMKEGATLFGWIHSVQSKCMVDIALEKKLTYVAWENMHHQSSRGKVHLFQANNEIAGYCAVDHALRLLGIDGYYGPQRKVKVLSFGSVGRGAVHALKTQGLRDIEVFTNRPYHLIDNPVKDIKYTQLIADSNHQAHINDRSETLLINELIDADIIINATLQDPLNPVMYMNDEDIKRFKKQTLVVDVSCDEGMGFPFAIPTSLDNPLLDLGVIKYYGVDHTPTLLWNSASYQITKSLQPFLKQFVDGDFGETMNNAVDIKKGIILNQDINTFQNR